MDVILLTIELISIIIVTVLTLYVWRNRRVQGGTAFAVFLTTITIGSFLYVLTQLVNTPMRMQVICYAILPVPWVIFNLQYAGMQRYVTRGRIIGLSIIPAISTFLLLTDHLHGLMYRQDHYFFIGFLRIPANPLYGSMFWVHTFYTYALMLIGIGILVWTALRTMHTYRAQSVALLLGALLPLILNILFTFELTNFLKIQPLFIGFTFTCVFIALSMYRYSFLDLNPIARDLLIDSMSGSMLVMDIDNRTVDINPSMAAFLEKPLKEVIGTPGEIILGNYPDLVAHLRDVNEVQAEINLSLGTKSLYYDLRITPLINHRKQLIGRMLVLNDISASKEAETKLKEAKEAAEAANRSKSVFLANMSHEIRTPMNAILGFSQLMQRDTSLTKQSRDHLDIINRSGEHLLAMINDILEMSKIEAGRSVFNPTTFDLHTLIYDIERMFRLRTDGKGLHFLMDKVGQVPRWVKTDEGKLRQVLINLLGNAVKFTDEGGIVLRICGKAENTDKVHLIFEMEDTGPGMSDDEIGHLFQAFEQTRSGLRSGGTGLGLALSRGFIEIMGGTISVTSTLGKGSIFRFNIPAQEDSEENAAKKEAKQRVLCLKPGQNEIRILIADDTETNLQLLLQLLAAVGFATNQAVNGEDAIRMVHEWKPHLVLMDMAMPVMDGYEATRKIKASPDIRNTAIVALTASAFEEDKKRILDAGADGYLSKPFKDAELFEIIGQLTGAEYLYEDTGSLKVSETADDKVLMRKTVAALPSDLVNQMRAAVGSADLDLLNELALQLAAQQPLLAKQIQEMATRYEYEALTKLFSGRENHDE